MEFQLVLVRHGYSLGNEKSLFSGWSDVPLTERGRRELRELRQVIRYPISDIPGINAGYLGKTARSGNQYPYNGSIENIKVFNTDIPDDTLTAWTLSGGF